MNNSPSGEPVTEFSKYDGKGPFKCGNCVHFEDGTCHHPVMMRESKQPKTEDGYVRVNSGDCCKFVRRPGER